VSKADILRAALVVAEAEEEFTDAKAMYFAGDYTDEEWTEAKRQLSVSRTKQRVILGRPGSDKYRIDDDGNLVGITTSTKAVKTRDENGNIIPELTEMVTVTTEEVLG